MRKQGGWNKQVRRVNVELINYALEIYKPLLWGRGRKLEILKGVSAIFEAGELNVIMGRKFLLGIMRCT
jgi:hypothetical protein